MGMTALFFRWTVFIITLTVSIHALAAGSTRRFHVFDVRRNLPMHDGDAIVRDYYINAGVQDGMKVGLVIPVFRRDPIHDIYGDVSDDLIAPIAQIKLIYVQRTLSIGRAVPFGKGHARPIQDFASIMQGDRLDIGNARLEDEGAEGGGDGEKQGDGAKKMSEEKSEKSAREKLSREPMQPAAPTTAPQIIPVPVSRVRDVERPNDGSVGQVTLTPGPSRAESTASPNAPPPGDASPTDDEDDEPVILSQ